MLARTTPDENVPFKKNQLEDVIYRHNTFTVTFTLKWSGGVDCELMSVTCLREINFVALIKAYPVSLVMRKCTHRKPTGLCLC